MNEFDINKLVKLTIYLLSLLVPGFLSVMLSYEGPANSFVTEFGLLQCYVLSNIFLLQTFKVFPLY